MSDNDEIKMKELDSSIQNQLTELFKGGDKFARFGDIGCLMAESFKETCAQYKNTVIRPDDVWVATFPRSGTTWTLELVWLLMNNLDYDTASKVHLTAGRTRHLELNHIATVFTPLRRENTDPDAYRRYIEVIAIDEDIPNMPSPRCINTHLPFSLLPTGVVEIAKVVYVARDPRDVVVSYYQLCKLLMNYIGDFKTFWNLFINDLVVYSPYLPHLKEAWALRDHPNMLIIFYEDMTRDLPSVIQRVASFLNKAITNEETKKLCEHLDINNFRKNKLVNHSLAMKVGNPDAEAFIRKGISGGWRAHFDEEMAAQAQSWMRAHLADCDLRFPDAHLK